MRASGYRRVSDDWYVEPAWIVDALLDAEPLSGLTWDPSCGGGNIAKALERKGIQFFASDIADRGYGFVNHDFLTSKHSAENIVTNPPYGIIEEYIKHALNRANNKVCILARLALLEGKARKAMFLTTPLARVWVSSRRVSMPPGGTDVRPAGGSIAYAWFVWERGYEGKPVIGWL